MSPQQSKAKSLLKLIQKESANQPEFLQAVEEVLLSLEDFLEENPRYLQDSLFERLVEPERIITFRVPWMDRKGDVIVSRGYRVQFNSAIGAYKGGLRFHPTVNTSTLKFLGFEQIFKNALTGLPLGGGKGGANFDPRGKTDMEVMRFCQAFMSELFRHIGHYTDVPAGDIGVGEREIGYLYGQYKKLKNELTGTMTGKGREWGGSMIRSEATGYGAIYFIQNMLKHKGEGIKGKRITLSGFGNVAWGSVKKAVELEAKVITISGPDGYIYIPDGMTIDMVDYLLDLRSSNKDIVSPFAEKFPKTEFVAGKRPWEVECDIAIPCAIQNELNNKDAENLIKNKCKLVAEASNMGCTLEAVNFFHKNKILFAPGKAVNAGGVAVSGLEMTQNSQRLFWTHEEVDDRLKKIMNTIHDKTLLHGKDGDHINYVKGANIAGFIRVAEAMIAQGIV